MPLEEEKKGEERRYLLPSARMNEGRFSSARGDQDSFIAFSYRATGSFRAKIRIETGSKRDYAKRNLRISPIRVDAVVTTRDTSTYKDISSQCFVGIRQLVKKTHIKRSINLVCFFLDLKELFTILKQCWENIIFICNLSVSYILYKFLYKVFIQ